MYRIFTYIWVISKVNDVGKYFMHGASGYYSLKFDSLMDVDTQKHAHAVASHDLPISSHEIHVIVLAISPYNL